MAADNAERFPIGRTALGGAACGFSYDAAIQDAVAREDRLGRPLRITRPWPATGGGPRSGEPAAKGREAKERARLERTA